MVGKVILAHLSLYGAGSLETPGWDGTTVGWVGGPYHIWYNICFFFFLSFFLFPFLSDMFLFMRLGCRNTRVEGNAMQASHWMCIIYCARAQCNTLQRAR